VRQSGKLIGFREESQLCLLFLTLFASHKVLTRLTPTEALRLEVGQLHLSTAKPNLWCIIDFGQGESIADKSICMLGTPQIY